MKILLKNANLYMWFIFVVSIIVLVMSAVFYIGSKGENVSAAESAEYSIHKDNNGDFIGIGLNDSFDGAFYAGVKNSAEITEGGLNYAAIEYVLDDTIFDKENGGLLIHLSTEGRTKSFLTRVYAFVGDYTNRMMNAHAGLSAQQCEGVNRYFIKDNGEVMTLSFSRTKSRLTIERALSGTLILPWKHMTDSTNGTITEENPKLRIVILTDLSPDTDSVRVDQGIIVSRIATYSYTDDNVSVVNGLITNELGYSEDEKNINADVNISDITKGRRIFCKREWNSSISVKQFVDDSDMSNAGKIEFEKMKVVSLINNENISTISQRKGRKISPGKVNVPEKMFVGWTSNLQTVPDLYMGDCDFIVNEDIVLYAYGIDYHMTEGASIRIKEGSNGIRFNSKIANEDYDKIKDYILSLGTMILPAKYVENTDFIMENFEPEYVLVIKKQSEGWLNDESYKSYNGAITNILNENTNLSFAGRGYIEISYTDGNTGYVYTPFDLVENSRSIYQVSELAYRDPDSDLTKEDKDILEGYINKVADFIIDGTDIRKASEIADYAIIEFHVAEGAEESFIKLDKNVNGLILNGNRISFNSSVVNQIEINNATYNVINLSISNNEDGHILSFDLEKDDN